jgi:hypothetical protein
MLGLDSSKQCRKGQAIVLFTLMLGSVLIPMVGMGIDGARAYIVKAKLSTAVDGGAIAAARLLSSGSDQTAQTKNAVATAKTFVSANFPNGYFGATLEAFPTDGSNPCVDLGDGSDPCKIGADPTNNYKKRTIVLTGYANVPTLFLRIIGFKSVRVRADGRASRRDVRVVLVIDRSSSMSGLMTGPTGVIPMAQSFVGKFAGGRDELGLVVFGGSAIVAYPPRDATNPTNYKPPNKDWADSTKGTTINTLLGQTASGSHTGTAEALYLAYMTLRADAATNTDLPNKLNVIVLFTDGLPNGITAFVNDPSNNALASGSPCTNKNLGATNPIVGWLAQAGGFDSYKTDGTRGTMLTMMTKPYPGSYTGKGDDISAWLQHPNDDSENSVSHAAPNMAGCNAFTSGSMNMTSDLQKIPDNDIYQNSTSFNPPGQVPPLYMLGDLYNNYGKATLALTQVDHNYQIGMASWNAAADQATKIWNNKYYDPVQKKVINDANPINPVIFTIGYDHTAAGGEKPDLTLLRILANDSSSPAPITNRVNGKAYLATNAGAVAQAFAEIASEILRLSQ